MGHGFMHGAGHETTMNIAQSAAAFAVGTSVTMLPMATFICCAAIPSVIASHFLALDEHSQSIASDSLHTPLAQP